MFQWDSKSQLDVIQPGFEPGTVVTLLALRCSALDRCAVGEYIQLNTRVLPITQKHDANTPLVPAMAQKHDANTPLVPATQ